MPMDEVIRAIEQADAENIQDVLKAVMTRYKELYPNWKMLYMAADPSATDGRSTQICELICQAERIVGFKKDCSGG